MPNTIITNDMVSAALAALISNDLQFAKLAYRAMSKEIVAVNNNHKNGTSIRFDKPIQVVANDGPDITSVDGYSVENYDTITVNKNKVVRLDFTTEDMAMKLVDFSNKYLKPASAALAQAIDADGADMYKEVYNAVGTAGVTPSTLASLLSIGQKLSEVPAPIRGRNLVINPAAEAALTNGFEGVFNEKVTNGIIIDGTLGNKGGFNIYMDQNVKAHTAGTPGGTPLVDGASQSGASVNIKGLTTTTGDYHIGDIITFADVYSVNLMSKQSTGNLAQFTVTALATADGSGDVSVSISPSIVTSGAYRNVTGSPANEAAVTLVASHTANLAFCPNTIALVTAQLAIPDGAAWATRGNVDGISVRIVKDFNILTGVEITRAEVYYGWKVLRPELCCRLLG